MSFHEMPVANVNHQANSTLDLAGTRQAIRDERQELGLPPYPNDEELLAAQVSLMNCRADIAKALSDESTAAARELDKVCGYRSNLSVGGPVASLVFLGSILVALALWSWWPIVAAGAIAGPILAYNKRVKRSWLRSCALFGVRQNVSREELWEARSRAIVDLVNEVRRDLHRLSIQATPEQIFYAHASWYWSALPKDGSKEERESVIEHLTRHFNELLRTHTRLMSVSDLAADVCEARYVRAVDAVNAKFQVRIGEARRLYDATVSTLQAEREAEIRRVNSGAPLVEAPLRIGIESLPIRRTKPEPETV